MAHEVKNSLTPIRLTVEEMLARYDEADRGFMEQATQIVVDEIETLERRIRAFSQFAAEPPVEPRPGGREFAAAGARRVPQDARIRRWPTIAAWRGGAPRCMADQDLVKGILTNLLENAAEAAGEGGRILGVTGGGERPRGHRGARFRSGAERAGARLPVSTHHFVQEEGHGAGTFHRAQERAAFGRGHRSGERRTGRRGLPRAAARGDQWHPNEF